MHAPVKSRLAPEALPVPRCNPIWLWDCMRQHLGPKWSYVNTYAGHPRESDTPHKLKLRAHRRFPASPRLECRVRLFISVQLCIDIYSCCARAFTHAHPFPISEKKEHILSLRRGPAAESNAIAMSTYVHTRTHACASSSHLMKERPRAECEKAPEGRKARRVVLWSL